MAASCEIQSTYGLITPDYKKVMMQHPASTGYNPDKAHRMGL